MNEKYNSPLSLARLQSSLFSRWLKTLRKLGATVYDALAPINYKNFRFTFHDETGTETLTTKHPRSIKGSNLSTLNPQFQVLHVFFSIDHTNREGLFAVINSIVKNTVNLEKLFLHILVDENPAYYEAVLEKKFPDQLCYEVVSFSSTPGYERNHNFLRNNIRIVGVKKPVRISRIMNFSRIYLPEIFPHIDFGLYLDADMIVLGDLTSLLNVRLYSHIVGSPLTRSFEGYDKGLKLSGKGFNTGFLLINFRLWRANHVTRKFESVMKRHKRRTLFEGGTQPLFNIVFYEQCFPVRKSWNKSGLGQETGLNLKELEKYRILHWSGDRKPWKEEGLYKALWERYRIPLEESGCA